jgi:oligoribonuclease NrnB/cAMP/cGMP phosphodiesterase (DHH superfamily)
MSCSDVQFDWWVTTEKKITVLDHHETAKVLRGKAGCVIDETRSGTELFFDEYVGPRIGRYRPIVQEFVNLVGVYDLWKLESPLWPKALDLNRVMFKYACWNAAEVVDKHERFISAMMRKLINDKEFAFNPTELRYVEESKEKEEEAYRRALDTLKIRKDHWGRRFGVFLAWGKISITASRLLYETDYRLDYVIAVQDYNNEYGKLSIRARRGGDFYCTDLGLFGGHVEASGCTLSPDAALRLYNQDVCFRYKREIKDENDIFVRSSAA